MIVDQCYDNISLSNKLYLFTRILEILRKIIVIRHEKKIHIVCLDDINVIVIIYI